MSIATGAEMAKRKVGRPATNRDDVTTKIDRTVYIRALTIARDRKIPVAELLTEFLREPIDKAYLEFVKRIEPKKGGKA